MKTISKLALAAVLATGVSGMALIAPATAMAKKEEAKPGLKLSPDVLKAAQVAQPAIAAKDFATAEPALAQIDAAAKTDDDKYIGAALRYDLEQQKLAAQQAANPNAPLNETVLAGPLDVLIANPSTPADMRGRYTYRRGALAFNGKQYPVAVQYFQKAKALGYTNEDLDLQIVKAKMESGDVKNGLADLDASVTASTAAGKKAPEDYYRYAISKANGAKLKPETFAWLQKYAVAYPSPKTWRDVIVTFGLQQNGVVTLDETQKIDMFRLMRQTKSLADQNDYLEYADSVNRRGLPSEAQAVLKEGMASGKIPASNTMAKTLLTDTATAIRNDGPLAGLEKKATTNADGKLAAGTADAYLGQDNYAKAIELYKVALSKGGVNADDVNLHLGIAQVKSGDKAGAAASFAAVKTTPRMEQAQLWTAWMNAPTA
jgi:hypothetical protein